MRPAKKKGDRPKMIGLTRGISRMYRVLLRLEDQLSNWRPQAEELFNKYQRTRDDDDFDAFAYHVSGEIERVRRALKEIGQ
jgi:hypothetical protein